MTGWSEPRPSELIKLMLVVDCCACGFCGQRSCVYPQACARRAGRRRASDADWRGDKPAIGRHGADLNRQVPDRRRAPHRAEHACRGIIPSITDAIHVRAGLCRWKALPLVLHLFVQKPATCTFCRPRSLLLYVPMVATYKVCQRVGLVLEIHLGSSPSPLR
jgi:hypothetical protein